MYPIISTQSLKKKSSHNPIRFLVLCMLTFVSLFKVNSTHAIVKTFGSPPGSYSTIDAWDYYYYVGMSTFNRYATASSIYSASEIGIAGDIDEFGVMRIGWGDRTVLDSVYIFMKEVGTTTSPSSTLSLAGFTEVFRGTFPNSSFVDAWQKVTLTTPFSYSGSQNLQVIIVQRRTSGANEYGYHYISYSDGSGFGMVFNSSNSNTYSNWLNTGTTTPSTISGLNSMSYGRIYAQINITPPPCTGTPDKGSAVASTTTACKGIPVTFTVTTKGKAASGVEYEWDTSSSASGPWIYAVTSNEVFGSWTFSVPEKRTLYYRARAKCSSGGGIDTSTAVAVTGGESITLPYIEDFEKVTVGNNVECASSNANWTTDSWDEKSMCIMDYSPNCGYAYNRTPGGNNFLFGSYGLETYDGVPRYWFSPAISFSKGKMYRLSYWYANDGSSWNLPGTQAFIGNAQNADAMNPIGDFLDYAGQDYKEYTTDFEVDEDGDYFIGLKMRGSGDCESWIDDINLIELPDCNTASALGHGGKASAYPNVICNTPDITTLSITGTPAFSFLTFSWEKSEGSASFATPIDVGTGLKVETEIESGGVYFFRCKIICEATGTFTYSDTVKVVTTPIAPPYIEDFETAIQGVNMPCADANYWWDYVLWTRTSPFNYYVPGIDNRTPGGKGYLFFGPEVGYYTGEPVYWFTPAIAMQVAKAYEVSFWYSNNGYIWGSSSSTEATDMGIKAGTSQWSGGMTIDLGSDTTMYLNSSRRPEWNQFKRGFIAPATESYYIGIWANNKNYIEGFAIDDIGINQLPPCNAKPIAGSAVASPNLICESGESTISLPGVSLASDLSFQWYEVTATGHVLLTGETAPSLTISLSTEGKYKYFCVVKCNAIAAPNFDTSSIAAVTVGALDLPYFEDFETAIDGVNMPCASHADEWYSSFDDYWNLKSGTHRDYSGLTNHTPGGKKYLHSGYYNGPYYNWGDQYYWFTPGLKFEANKAYKVSFWFNGSGYDNGNTAIKFGVYTGTEQSSSGMIYRSSSKDTFISPVVNKYQELVRFIYAPTTDIYYVGIKAYHTGYNYPGIAIDDIGISQLLDCAGKPIAGTPDATPNMICASGTTRLQLSGNTIGSDMKFQWLQSSSETGMYSNVIGGSGANTSSYLTAELTSTTYFKCVVTCNASGMSDTSAFIKVNVGFIEPPYKEDFEEAIVGINVPCASNNGTWSSASTTSDWTIKGALAANGYRPKNLTIGGSQYLFAGTNLGTYSTSTPRYWFTPAIRLQKDSTYEFTFSFLGSSNSTGATNLSVLCGTTQNAAGMTIPVGAELVAQNTISIKQYIGRVIAPSSANYYFGIRNNHTTNSYPGMAIDDIGLNMLPMCDGKPTAGKLLSSTLMLCTPGTLKLGMDFAGASKSSGLSYTWYAATSAGVLGTPIASKLTDPAFTTGVISTNTWFSLVVKCEKTGDSTVAGPLKVDVGVIIPPYLETFESAVPPNNLPCASFTSAWGTNYWYIFNGPFDLSYYPWINNHTPGGSKYLFASYNLGYTWSSYPGGGWWFTPLIKFDAGQLYQFSMWYNGSGYSAPAKTEMQVSYGAAQSASAMTTTIIPLFTDNTSSYKKVKKQFTSTISGNMHIGIFVKNWPDYAYPGIAIDDIGLDQILPCDATVVAGNIVSNPIHICDVGGTAELDLEEVTLATGLTYSFYYGNKPNFMVTPSSLEGTVTSLPYTTVPLSSTRYYKCVVTCSATGASDTTEAFKMGVAGFDLPYNEDFESVNVGGKPLCSDANFWGRWFDDGWRVYGSWYTDGYKNHTPDGKNFLIAGYTMGTYDYYSPITDKNFWYTPGFNLSNKYKYQLSFYYLASSPYYSSTGNRMGVYIGRSQSAGAMTTAIHPLQLYNNTSWDYKDTTFRVAIDGIYYLGFQKASGSFAGDYSPYGVAFDDINLNYAPCDGVPIAGRVISNLPSGTGFCPGTPIVLEDTGATVLLVPGIKYQWFRRVVGATDWTPIIGENSLEISGDQLMGYDYKFGVICGNTSDTTYSNIFSVPFLPPHPNVVITSSTSPVMYCAGDSVKLNATYYNDAVYDWYKDTDLVFGWKHSDIGVVAAGRYFAKVTSPLSLCPAYSDTIEIQEIDPGYSVTITKPLDSFACKGNSILLTAMSSLAGVTYSWTQDGVVIPGATSAIYSANVTGVYRVFVHDGISTCKAASRSIKITIKDNPIATIKVPSGSATGCEYEGVLLNAGNKGFGYTWMFNGVTVAGASDSMYTAKISGDYQVKVFNADGCATMSSIVTVTILPAPTPVITQIKIGSGIELGLTMSYLGYQWYKDGVEIPAPVGISNTYFTSNPGVYRVKVKDFNGCEGEAIIDLNGVLHIDENLQNDVIRLFPNPTTGIVNIKSPIRVKVIVTDATGKLVTEMLSNSIVDLSKYADGVYLFKVLDLDGKILIPQQKVNKISEK
jgi:hypothetical protein